MKSIIVPTDFSATSRNAFEYAKHLAARLNIKIKIVHVHDPYGDLTLSAFDKSSEDPALEAMRNFTEGSDKVFYETEILRGDVVRELVRLSKRTEEEVFVMGSTGLQDFIAKIMGTVSLDIANKAESPVIIVPRDAQFQPIRRILFATSIDSVTPTMIREAVNFAEIFKASMHFVHIDKGKPEKTDVLKQVMDELTDNLNVKQPFELISLGGSNIVEQLKDYAEKNAIDLLVFVSRHRNFWQNLIHKSITQQIALSVEKPMMVMHFEDK